MKAPVATVAACLVAGAMTTHVPLARAASEYGLVSAAGAVGTTPIWSYDTAPVSVGGARYAASARSDYGINQASSSTKPGAHAYAGSLWWDQYTISGGVGTGSTDFSAALAGNMSSAGSAGAAVGYVLMVSTVVPAAFELDFSSLVASNTLGWVESQIGDLSAGSTVLASYVDGVFYGPDEAFAQAYAGSFDFTYDSPFYIGALLITAAGGSAGKAGIASTAVFTLAANPDDVVTVASAVPEPGQWSLLLAGLGLVAWRVRRQAGKRA